MFRCSTPLTQRPWSNTHIHMHTGLQTNTEARCTCMFTLCGDSHAYTQVCILPRVAEEVHFKEKRRGRFYAYDSHEQQLSVWQRKIKECVKVLFVLDFPSIYDCFFCAGQLALVPVPSADTVQMCLASQGSCSWHSCLGRMSQILSFI